MNNPPLFTRLYLAKLGVDHAYALVHATVALAREASLHFDPLTRQAVQYMADCNTALEANLKAAGQQDHTQRIRTLDHQCGQQWAALRRGAKYYAQDGNAAQQAAGQEWLLFLAPYGKLPTAALNTQMALLSELMDKYLANTSLRKAAEVLGLQERLLCLQRSNEELIQLYQQRNMLATARTRTHTQLKLESLAAYRRFCALLEQACWYTQSEPLLALVHQLNGYRTKYQTIIARRKTRQAVAAAPATPEPCATVLPPESVANTEQPNSIATLSASTTARSVAVAPTPANYLEGCSPVCPDGTIAKVPTAPTQRDDWHRLQYMHKAMAKRYDTKGKKPITTLLRQAKRRYQAA